MEQLSGVDASFLNMETNSVFGHVSAMYTFNVEDVPGGASFDTVRSAILERLDLLPVFRRRLVTVPLGLDLPYWIEDPNFDIDFHVRHHAVPAPGTPRQLAEVVNRIISRPLDRSRPLWEFYVIEGISKGTRVAHLNKIHHSTIDGESGAALLKNLLSVDPASRPTRAVAEWKPDVVPSDQELLLRTAVEYIKRPEKFVRLTVNTLREIAAQTQSGSVKALADIVAQPIPGPVGDLLRSRLRSQTGDDPDRGPALPPTSAPRTPWNATVTPHRRFAFTTIPLEEAKIIRRATGATFNDVVMALCGLILRKYLLTKDALPDKPLIALVPVSTRADAENTKYQNRVTGLLAELGTDESDPLALLRRVQLSMSRAKTTLQAIPAESLQDFTQFAPPLVAARAMRMYSRLRIADRLNPPFNLIISNVPGPQQPLYSAGARMEHFYPVSAIADGQGLNITVQSYCGNLDFGFVSCRELVPDIWQMVELLNAAFDELKAAALNASGAE
jgi:WS/DGAT/MGAT family acyltransferase